MGEKAVEDKVAQLHAEITALTKYYGTASDIEIYPMMVIFRFRHPHLVELMGFHRSTNMVALVYEYLEEGSLYSHLHDVCKAMCS